MLSAFDSFFYFIYIDICSVLFDKLDLFKNYLDYLNIYSV